VVDKTVILRLFDIALDKWSTLNLGLNQKVKP
jgi:hypothetical protein